MIYEGEVKMKRRLFPSRLSGSIFILIFLIWGEVSSEPFNTQDSIAYTGWDILSSYKVPGQCRIVRPCPDGSNVECSASGWFTLCQGINCVWDTLTVPGVRCMAFPGGVTINCYTPPIPIKSTPNLSDTGLYFASYTGEYEQLLESDTIFAVKPLLTSYQLVYNEYNDEILYHRIEGYTLYTVDRDSLRLGSIDGIVKIVPISTDEWMVVSPTGIYKYVVSINVTKRLAEYKDRVYSPQCVDVNLPYIGISTFNGIRIFLYESDSIKLVTRFQPEVPTRNIKYSWQKHNLYKPIVHMQKIVLVHLSSPYVTIYDMSGEHQKSISFNYPDYFDQLIYVDTTLKASATGEASRVVKCFLYDATLMDDNKLLCGFCGTWFTLDLNTMEVTELAFYDEQHSGTLISQIAYATDTDTDIKLVNVLPLSATIPQIEILSFKP